MAETLRDLVVNLSLNSNNFNANMRMINKQMQEANSAFKLAGAGIENFENKTAGLHAKTALLQNKQNLLNKSLEQYRKQVTSLEKKLGDQYRDYDDYNKKLAKQEEAYKSLGKQIKEYKRILNDEIDYSSPFGREAADQMRTELEGMTAEYTQMGSEITKTRGQIDALERSMRKTETTMAGTKAGLNIVEAELKECNRQLKQSESGWTEFALHAENVSTRLTAIGGQLSSFGGMMSRGVTVPLIAAGGAIAKSSISFEDAMAGVRKTVVGVTEDYDNLAEAARKLSRNTPVDSATEILAVYEAAGQLGIATEAVSGFGEAMVYMGEVASDLSALDAADSLARFTNITGLEQTNDNFWRLSNTIYYLANSMATTESEVIALSLRLAGAGRQVGLTEAEIVAFAAALSSVGIESEAGGTAFSKAMTKIELAVAEGGSALTDFAKVAGMSEETFAKTWRNNPAEGLMAFIVGLSQMSEEGISAISVLSDLGLNEARLRDSLLRATNASELFNDALVKGNEAWETNDALTVAAAKRFDTTANKFKMVKNKVADIAMEFGDVMLPEINKILERVGEWIEKFSGLDEATRSNIVTMGMYAAAAGPVLKVTGNLVSGIGNISGAMAKFATWMAKGSAGAQMFTASVGGLGKAIGVTGLVASVVAGVVALEKFVSGAAAAEAALESMQETADKWTQGSADTFYRTGGGLSAFGLDVSDFNEARQTMQEWYDELIQVWTDGAPETDEIVEKYGVGFKQLADNTISSLEELRASADKNGMTGLTDEIDSDIAELESMADEVDALLKKRQNGYITEAEQQRLQELMDKRDAIIVRYQLQPDTSSGYEDIINQVHAAERRAAVTGSEVAQKTYEEAAKAAGEGFAAVNTELDNQYDKQVELASLIEDEGEREKALAAADAEYMQKRKQAAEEYASTLSQITPELISGAEFTDTQNKLNRLTELMGQYKETEGKEQAGILEEINALTEGLDEGALVDYLGVLTQIQSLLDYGMDPTAISTLFPEFTGLGSGVETLIEQYSALSAWVAGRKEELGGLNEMFNEAIPEEMTQITVDLNLDAAAARWEEFKTDASVITTDAIIASYNTSPKALAQRKTATQLAATIGITSIERSTLDDYIEKHPGAVSVQGGILRLSSLKMTASALVDAEAQIVDLSEGGLPVPITPKAASKLTGEELVVTDEEGKITVFVSPKWSISGDPAEDLNQAVTEFAAPNNTITPTVLKKEYEIEIPVNLQPYFPKWSSRDAFNTLDTNLGYIEKWWNVGGLVKSDKKEAQEYLENLTNPDDWAEATQFVSAFWGAVNSGAEVSEEQVAAFNTIIGVIEKLSSYGAGGNERGNLAEALAGAGFETSVDTLVGDLQAVYDQAVLVGENVPQGLTDGVEKIGGAAVEATGEVAQAMIDTTTDVLDEHSPSRVFHKIGVNAMLGMAQGVTAGSSSVTAAIRRAALNAVSAAKNALKIHSPSRVFQTEVGEMIMEGIGVGITGKIADQSRIIANASRQLTTAAQGAVGGNTYDNHNTYNQQSSATVNIEKYVANDQQDVYALAVETAALIRRKQRGRGK